MTAGSPFGGCTVQPGTYPTERRQPVFDDDEAFDGDPEAFLIGAWREAVEADPNLAGT